MTSRKKTYKLQGSLDKAAQYRRERDELIESAAWHSNFLDRLSERDGLTGLFNRRSFNSIMKKSFQEAKKTQ